MSTSDVEKGQPEKIQDGTEKDDYDLKKDGTEVDEPAEDSPLKGHTTDAQGNNEAPLGEKSGGKEGGKGLREWLSKSRVKWWIAVLVAVILLTVVLVGTLLAVEVDEYDVPDPSIRMVKMWPRPNRPRKLINFVHGSLPVEGRIWPDLTHQLDQLLARYQPVHNKSRKIVECYTNSPPEGSVCNFDLRTLMMECTRSMNYGYDQGKPCIFLEFNNITDWQPEPFATRDLDSKLDIPEDLRYHYKPNMVFLDCQGDSLVDQENMGPIQYTPDRGFPNKYFPYRGHPHYMSPLVAIRFSKPAIGVAISVTCKLWAKNINHTDDAIPSGQISFNLLVD